MAPASRWCEIGDVKALWRALGIGLLAVGPLPDTMRAQSTGTIVGHVIDSATSAPKRGATAALPDVPRMATANERGMFVLGRVPAGSHTLVVRMRGYRTVSQLVDVRADDTVSVEIRLPRDATLLEAVRAEVRAEERELFESRPNVAAVTLSARAVESVPRLGESDVVRVVQLLPGVQARNDFSTGLNVRGGESDQNLILIDGYPVYNPFHLGGLFSTFMGATVGDVQLLTGAFPARFGGRLSSVLDVHSAEERRAGLHGTAEISVLASTLSLGSTFDNGNGSWSVAGRRTYADQVTDLFTTETYPYHFRDEQAHLTYRFPDRTRLAMTLYDGRDVLDGSFAETDDSSTRGATGGAFLYSWGNLVLGATLTKPIEKSRLLGGDSTLLEQRASVSRFSMVLDLGAGAERIDNTVSDARISGTVTTYTARHDWSVGYEVASYDILYETAASTMSLDRSRTQQSPVVAALHADDLWRMGTSWLVAAGGRLETVSSRPWSGASPRLSVKYLASHDAAFTAAAGRFTQWTHSLSLEENPIRLFDFWQASDASVPVATAWQFVVGHERWFGTSRFARVELFDKRYDNLVEHREQEDPQVTGDEYLTVQGRSYGADVLLREVGVGPFTGWLAYSFQVGTRQHDSVRYTPAQDRRHDLNVVASWKFRSYVAGARIGYASGLPYTDIVGVLQHRSYDPFQNQWGTARRATQQVIGAERNGARLPATRRLDLFIERPYQWRDASVKPYLSIVNASNEKNVLYYEYDFTTSPASRRALSQIPILPSIGVSVAF